MQQQVVLRYRSPGHVRFALPAALCQPGVAERLVAGLSKTPGVYQVDLYRRQGKLSIRYLEGMGDFMRLTSTLHRLVAQSEKPIPAQLVPSLSENDNIARSAVQPIPTAARKTDKFLLEFFTDVLVLYLIKAHWHLITLHWLKRPWQYRYEWMAALYLIFLLVLSKRPKP